MQTTKTVYVKPTEENTNTCMPASRPVGVQLTMPRPTFDLLKAKSSSVGLSMSAYMRLLIHGMPEGPIKS